MSRPDMFDGLARHYEAMMAHVDYYRWFAVVTELAGLLPDPVRHLDAACGTGKLLRELRRVRWDSIGFDLSGAMLDAAHKSERGLPIVRADLRAVPFRGAFDYVTCLFDSMNFLLDEGDLRRAVRELAGCLRPGGILYFDVVTERMVTEHFAGQRWKEKNGRFTSSWESHYAHKTRVAETEIRVNNGPTHVIRERTYPLDTLASALDAAGLSLLAVLDSETWRPVRDKTIRIDFVAVRGDAEPYRPAFDRLATDLRRIMR